MPCGLHSNDQVRITVTNMSHLDTRSRDILMVLLKAETPITVKQIAGQLGITPRMMRANLNIIQDWLEDRKATLIRKPNFGLQIQAARQQREQLINELFSKSEYMPYLSPAERVDTFVFLLLRSNPNLLPSEEVELALGISRSTILKDMEKAKGWLETFNLDVTYAPRKGFRCQGSEATWREAVVHLLITKLGTLKLLSLGNGPDSPLEGTAGADLNLLNRALVQYLEQIHYPAAFQTVKRVENAFDHPFIGIDFARLACHLALAAAQSAAGRHVELPGWIPRKSPEEDAKAVRELLAETALHLPDIEAEYFLRQIRGSKVQYTLKDLLSTRSILFAEAETQEIVENIVNEASLYLHPYLKVDQQLFRALIKHIQVAKNRLKYNLPIDNPMTDAIRAQYPQIFRIAQESLAGLEKKVNKAVPPEEVAYVAMHLGAAMERLHPRIRRKWKIWVVCGDGPAVAGLLMARLQVEFPEMEIVEPDTALELKNLPQTDQADLIISTLPVTNARIPALQVSPLLPKEDKARILTALTLTDRRKEIELGAPLDPSPALSSLLTEATIALRQKLENWEAVVEMTGELLQNVSAIQSRYTQAMKEVIYRYGPYVVFTPGVALLHAKPEDGVNRICMSIITLDPPVTFHHPYHDPVQIAIGFCMVDNQSHLRALAQLANLLSDQQRLSQVKAARTKAEVLSLFTNEV